MRRSNQNMYKDASRSLDYISCCGIFYALVLLPLSVSRKASIDWQFTNEDARIKLMKLYPKL